MTQDLRGAVVPPTPPRQFYPLCTVCGVHKKSSTYRQRIKMRVCDGCAMALPKRYRRG